MFKGLFIFLLLGSLTSGAQYDNVWAFGNLAGLDFSTNPPSPIKTALETTEGSASICDVNGDLLFYTDGTSVWDRNNQLMPNGEDLPGVGINITASTTQGALIVPMPGTQHKYYLFSLGNVVAVVAESPYYGRLYYSIIDMNLNGGRGDVVPGSKGIQLDTFFMEQMTAASGNDCNIWLLATSRDSSIKVYNIDVNGITANPVISKRVAGERYAIDHLGTMIVTPDRSKLVISKGNLVLYDFDAESGRVSNPVILESEFWNRYYAAAFSPDNTKLYASGSYGIVQFEVNGTDSAAIVKSSMNITNLAGGAMRLGPDGRIYIVGSANLPVIQKPNLKGVACDFEKEGVLLKEGTSCSLGITNMITIVTNRKVIRVKSDTAFCTQSHLLSAINTSGMRYVWDDGSKTTSRLVDQPGVYWVSYQVQSPCMFDEITDTFKVVFDFLVKDIYTSTKDSGMCSTDTVLMKASNLNGTNYVWEDGSSGTQRKTNRGGIYRLNYQVDSLCANHIDSFIISYPEKAYQVSFMSDSIICLYDTMLFQNTSDAPYNEFKWSFGDDGESLDKSAKHYYTASGGYNVMLSGTIDGICPDTAYKSIIVDSEFPISFTLDRDSICVGEAISFGHLINGTTVRYLNWDFGDGYTTDRNDKQFNHAYDQAGIMPVTLIAKFRACRELTFRDTVSIFALPYIDLGLDKDLCINQGPIILRNNLPVISGIYRWNTGETSESIKVVVPGIYSLTVSTEPIGCHSTESIEIKKGCYMDIPNAFTPDGDGINDYFLPRQMLSIALSQFKMQVFNRGGLLLFETARIDGRGWDGKFDDKDQPKGVYVYIIEVEFENNTRERYQGNITLL